MFRKQIVVDRHNVSGTCLEDFPVLVAVTAPCLRPADSGGRALGDNGEDIFFADERGERLVHEIERYVPATGELKAWVLLPALSDQADTVFYLCCGAEQAAASDAAAVWDRDYRLVLHLAEDGRARRDSTANSNHAAEIEGCLRAASSESLDLADAITVEAWVECDGFRAEALQSAVSKWRCSESLDRFAGFDAGNVGGLNTKGYYGAVFDGRYVYFSPEQDGPKGHGRVLRLDTHADFHDPAAWSAFDAGATRGLSTKGYYGGVLDEAASPQVDRAACASRGMG